MILHKVKPYLAQAMPDELEAHNKLDWSKNAACSSKVFATQGGDDIEPNPAERAKKGTKHHALTEGNGWPIAVQVTAANRHDVSQIKPMVKAIPKVKNPKTKEAGPTSHASRQRTG